MTNKEFDLSKEREELKARLRENEPVSINLIFQYIKTQDREFIKRRIENINHHLQMILDEYVLYGYKNVPTEEVEKRLRDILNKTKSEAGKNLSGNL